MSNIDLFRMGIKNLWRRKLRTFLTVLGVIIGASSIIVMISLGFGMSASLESQISEWGDLTIINVHKKWVDSSMPGQKEVPLDNKALLSFKELPNVMAVSPTLQTYGKILNGRYETHVNIQGIDPDSMEDFGFEVAEGRLLNDKDGLTVVFGNKLAERFRDPNARIWREIKVDLMKDRMSIIMNEGYMMGPGQENKKPKEYDIKAAGILTEGTWETNYSIYLPISELDKIVKEQQKDQDKRNRSRDRNTGYDQVNVKVNDINNVQVVQDTIKEMNFEAYSLNDELESFKKQALVVQAVLGGIGAISLLVAAIGITNTMVMSIYERTKEIGVMKVIGASLKDIKRLFLFESALIGLTGGVFGVGISYVISYLMNTFGAGLMNSMGSGADTNISIIPIWLVLAAMAFSALIGIMSGYFPARRAMNLSALEAIRTE